MRPSYSSPHDFEPETNLLISSVGRGSMRNLRLAPQSDIQPEQQLVLLELRQAPRWTCLERIFHPDSTVLSEINHNNQN